MASGKLSDFLSRDVWRAKYTAATRAWATGQLESLQSRRTAGSWAEPKEARMSDSGFSGGAKRHVEQLKGLVEFAVAGLDAVSECAALHVSPGIVTPRLRRRMSHFVRNVDPLLRIRVTDYAVRQINLGKGNERDGDGLTALHYLALFNDIDILAQIVRGPFLHTLKPKKDSHAGVTPLQLAQYLHPHSAIVRMLQDMEAKIKQNERKAQPQRKRKAVERYEGGKKKPRASVSGLGLGRESDQDTSSSGEVRSSYGPLEKRAQEYISILPGFLRKPPFLPPLLAALDTIQNIELSGLRGNPDPFLDRMRAANSMLKSVMQQTPVFIAKMASPTAIAAVFAEIANALNSDAIRGIEEASRPVGQNRLAVKIEDPPVELSMRELSRQVKLELKQLERTVAGWVSTTSESLTQAAEPPKPVSSESMS